MKLFFAIILCFMIQSSAFSESIDSNQKISSEDIRNAGVTRPSDLFFLIDKWNISTTDGYIWNVNSSHLNPGFGDQWVVLLNGQKLVMHAFDGNNINLLPISINQIDSIKVFSKPEMHSGEISEMGLMHIYSNTPSENLTFSCDLTAANETGDPGPFKYTDKKTPNVDRLGKDALFNVEYGNKSFYASANLLLQEQVYTDFAMRRRIHSMTRDGWGHMHGRGLLLRTGLISRRHRSEVQFIHSETLRYFMFFKPFGREIPLNYHYRHLGARGEYSLSDKRSILYRAQIDEVDLEERENLYHVDFDWKNRDMIFNIEASAGSHKAGIGYERVTLHTEYDLDRNFFNVASAWLDLHFNTPEKSTWKMSMMLKRSAGNNAAKIFAAWRLRVKQSHYFSIHISHTERLVEEENPFWYWVRQGYGLLDRHGWAYEMPGGLQGSTQSALDMNFTFSPYNKSEVRIGGTIINNANALLERRTHSFNNYSCYFPAATLVSNHNIGLNAGLDFTMESKMTEHLSSRLYYGFTRFLKGGELFRGISRSVPSHKFTGQFTWKFASNLSFWLMYTHLSATRWAEYDEVDGTVCDAPNQLPVVYHSAPGSLDNIDLHLQKWFWHRHVSGSLIVRNLLNKKIQYHPVGASFDLSFYVKLNFYFNL